MSETGAYKKTHQWQSKWRACLGGHAKKNKKQTRSFYSSKFIVKIDLSWNTLHLLTCSEKENLCNNMQPWGTFVIFLFQLLNGTIWPMVSLVFFTQIGAGWALSMTRENVTIIISPNELGDAQTTNIPSWTWCSLSRFGTMKSKFKLNLHYYICNVIPKSLKIGHWPS